MSKRVGPRIVSSTPAVAVGLAVAALYSAILAYPVVFGGRAIFGDEGYVIASLASFADRGHLYTETFSQYGPGFYSTVGLLFDLMDVGTASLGPGRWATLVLIVLSGTSGGVAVWLFTRRALLALMAQLFVVAFLLTPQVQSPLHPGHVLALLLMLVAACLAWGTDARRRRVAGCVGALLATLALIKVNVGGLAFGGVVAAVTALHPSRRIRLTGLALGLLLPVGLLAVDAGDAWVRTLLFASVLGVLVVYVGLQQSPRVRLPAPVLVSFVRWMLIAAGLLTIPVLLTGSSIFDVVDGALIAPTRQRNVYSVPFEADIATVWSIIAVVIVAGALWANRTARYTSLAMVRSTAGLTMLLLLADDPRQHLAALVVLAACGAISGDRGFAAVSRSVLVMMAVLQPLHAYPTAGRDQVGWGSLLLVIVAFVNLAAGLPPLTKMLTRFIPGRVASGLVSATVVVVIAAVGGVLPRTEYATFGTLEPLSLPGASSVRLRLDNALIDRELAGLLQSHCDSYYSLPGINRFYVLAEMPLVTGLNTTAWPALFDVDTQRRVVEDLDAFEGELCLLHNDRALEFVVGRADRIVEGPLFDFVDRFTVEVGRVQNYVVFSG